MRRAGIPAHRHAGFSLLELFISVTIGLLVLVGVARLYVTSASSERTNSALSDLSNNGRFALEALRREIIHAGYRGVTAPPVSTSLSLVGSITNECLASGFAANLTQGLWGSNNQNPFSGSCIPTANYSQGDVLVVRRAGLSNVDNNLSAVLNLTANTLYLRSSFSIGQIFLGTTANANTVKGLITQTPWLDYPLNTTVFYVSPYTTSATESPKVPALYAVTLGSGPAMTNQLVASNVETIHFQYAVTGTSTNTQLYNATTLSALSAPTATALTNTGSSWDQVKSVYVWLLLRASTPETGYTNNSTYVLGDLTIDKSASPDNYRRTVVSMVVNVRNQ
jgi:type IV pilus assembly protein PilW